MVDKTITLKNMNPNIKRMEYAVRGPLVAKALEMEKELLKGISPTVSSGFRQEWHRWKALAMRIKKSIGTTRPTPTVHEIWAHFFRDVMHKEGVKKPFTEVIKANIGDCHAMGQKPLTYIRQVLSICTYPKLLNEKSFPEDIKSRAKALLNSCAGGSVGSYTHSTGIEIIKKHVAEYIERRDGIPADENNIILSSGASEAVKYVLNMLNYPNDGKLPGIMIPIPQYPLYSATICEYGMHQIGYYLDEDNDWALSIEELKRALDESKKVAEPRALVVINPGNPTGSVLTRGNIEEIIRFAYNEKLCLLADEVYQDNVYADGMKFYSFKKVLIEMGPPYNSMELVSFMSASKGYMGECGLRAGYCELINFDPEVKSMLLKAVSARLCSSVLGQIALDCIVSPPKNGEASYELFMKEKEAVLSSLKERAISVANAFNSMTGIKCNKVAGAMYAFPRVALSKKAIEKAKSVGQEPDFFYAMHLLEETGICVVAGSGFGQIPGTYHFRTTILPQPDKLKVMLERFREFHEKFQKDYN